MLGSSHNVHRRARHHLRRAAAARRRPGDHGALPSTGWPREAALTRVAQAEKLTTILKAAGVEVESYWPGLFAKTLAAQSLDSLITNIGSGARRGEPAAGRLQP